MAESPHTIKSSTIERQSLEYEDTVHSTKYQDSLRRHTQATWHAVRLQLWKRCDECWLVYRISELDKMQVKYLEHMEYWHKAQGSENNVANQIMQYRVI